MAVVQYRQLSAPEAVDTTQYNDGSAAAATKLAATFKDFTNDSSVLGQEMSSSEGAKAGDLAGAVGDPNLHEGFTKYTAYSQAYNNAATRSYAIRSEGDAEETAARLEVQANNDPTLFQATFGAVRDATLAQAPPEARGMVADVYNKRMAEGMTRVITAQQEEFKKQARVDVSEGIARSTDRIANWQASDDPTLHAQADDEQVKLGLMIDGAKGDGTLSQTEADSAHIMAQRSITEQTVTYRFKNEMNNPYGDPVAFIQRLQDANRTSETLDPQEESKLVTTLFETLRQKNALDTFDKRHNGTLEQMRYEVGDRSATSQLLAGQLTQKTLLDMVTSQNLKPETARTLLDQLNKGDETKDDPKSVFDVKTDLLNYTDEEITSKPGITWKTKAELIDERNKEALGWRGTQQAKEGEGRIERALGIVPGTDRKMLSDDELTQLQQAKTTWYNQVDAMDPAQRQGSAISTAESVIGTYIRKQKSDEAVSQRTAKARWIASEQASHGDPGSYGTNMRKAYDARVKKYDDNIAAAEAEAARK